MQKRQKNQKRFAYLLGAPPLWGGGGPLKAHEAHEHLYRKWVLSEKETQRPKETKGDRKETQNTHLYTLFRRFCLCCLLKLSPPTMVC